MFLYYTPSQGKSTTTFERQFFDDKVDNSTMIFSPPRQQSKCYFSYAWFRVEAEKYLRIKNIKSVGNVPCKEENYMPCLYLDYSSRLLI